MMVMILSYIVIAMKMYVTFRKRRRHTFAKAGLRRVEGVMPMAAEPRSCQADNRDGRRGLVQIGPNGSMAKISPPPGGSEVVGRNDATPPIVGSGVCLSRLSLGIVLDQTDMDYGMGGVNC